MKIKIFGFEIEFNLRRLEFDNLCIAATRAVMESITRGAG